MSVRLLVPIIGIVFTIFMSRAIATEEVENVGVEIKEAITTFIGGSGRERIKAAEGLAVFKPEDLMEYGAWEPFTKVLMEDDSPQVQQAVVDALGVQGNNASGVDKQKIIDIIVKTIRNENIHSVVRAKAIVIIGPLMSRDIGAKYKGRVQSHGMTTEKQGRVITGPLVSRDIGERGLVASYLEKLLDANDTILTKAIMETLNLWNWDLGDRIWKNVVTDDPDPRRQAIKALKNQIVQNDRKISPVKASDLLYIIDSDQRNKDLRIDLIYLLTFAVKNGSKINIADTLDRIIKKNSDSQVTLAAVEAIGVTNDPNLMSLLLTVLDKYKDNGGGEGIMIRSAACAAAGEFFALPDKHYEYLARYRRTFEKLSETLVETLLKDKSNHVRKEAAYSLGHMRSEKLDRRKPVAALIEVVNDPDESVANTVLDSLKFIAIQDFGRDVEAWQRWYQANQHYLIAK
jgi:HEAT repeat protein